MKDMKKMYKQPIVEQAEMQTGSIVMAGSPGATISGGGSSSGQSGETIGE